MFSRRLRGSGVPGGGRRDDPQRDRGQAGLHVRREGGDRLPWDQHRHRYAVGGVPAR